jgi:hypothetical protein
MQRLASLVAAAVLSAPVATPIAHFISLEPPGSLAPFCASLAVVRSVATVAVLWIEAVIYMAVKVIGAMKPGANADECASMEPFWSVIAIRSTAIRSVVIVTIGTYRGDSDADADLSRCLGSTCRNQECSNSG